MLGTIIFVAVNFLPAIHFIEFSTLLQSQGYDVQIYATGRALTKFHEHHLPAIEFNPQGISLTEENSDQVRLLAKDLANQFQFARAIITEVGCDLMGVIHQELALIEESPIHLAYYENPENFVPGGYSRSAAKAMQSASGVLFANRKLAAEPIYEELGQPALQLDSSKRFGIGFYPLEQIQSLREKRERSHQSEKLAFLEHFGLHHRYADRGDDADERVLVYFGGNNDEYFRFAFPKFLEIVLEAEEKYDLSRDVIVIQRHPGAIHKGYEPEQVKTLPITARSPRWIMSEMSSDNALIVADAAFYYQTTLANQFAFCGLPTLQVAHRPYLDLLVRSGLSQVATNKEDFIQFLQEDWNDLELKRKRGAVDTLLLDGLGIDPDHWQENLSLSLEILL
jgi:hypothetical protein